MMETMSEDTYVQLRSSAKVLEADGYGDKVLLLTDGRIMKLFRIKKILTSARIFPYNKRFASNREVLVKQDVPTVSDVSCFKLPSRKRYGVFYQPLEGETLRRLGLADQLTLENCADAGSFVAGLHDKGILFRSIHLGNIVLCTDGRIGLIDIADMSRQPLALVKSQRLRNFRHMFRPREEQAYLTDAHRQALIGRYLERCPAQYAADERFRASIEETASRCPQ